MTLLLTLILFQAVPDCAAWNSAGAAFSSGVHYFETATAEEVRACLSSGFDPNARIDEYTPLHLAAVAGNLDAIEVLLAAGADPAARLETDSAVDFYTPLEYAVAFGNEAAVEALRNGRARAESTGATASAGQVGDDPLLDGNGQFVAVAVNQDRFGGWSAGPFTHAFAFSTHGESPVDAEIAAVERCNAQDQGVCKGLGWSLRGGCVAVSQGNRQIDGESGTQTRLFAASSSIRRSLAEWLAVQTCEMEIGAGFEKGTVVGQCVPVAHLCG